MANVSRDRVRDRLEQELQTGEYQNQLRRLQQKEPFFRQFKTWADVLTLMRSGTSRDTNKDEVLRPILTAHTADQDHRWRTILLVLFWPGLRSIHNKKRLWDREDPDELWQRIYWAFHQSVCRIDVARRRDGLVQRIYNDTIHRLHDDYRREWLHADREAATDPVELSALAGVAEGIDFEGMDLREACQKEIDRLQGHLDAGRISEADFLLLIGTRLYGQSISEYARGAGLNTEAAKKRRQRAEALIRQHEKGMP
jgi:hypothetical protein